MVRAGREGTAAELLLNASGADRAGAWMRPTAQGLDSVEACLLSFAAVSNATYASG